MRQFDLDGGISMEVSPNQKGFALVSGGKDSTLMAYEMALKGRLEGIVFVETTIGLKETRNFVIELASRFGWKLYFTKGYRNFENYVVKRGFPHITQHNMVYNQLKYDAFVRFVRRMKKENGKLPLLFSGVRKEESSKRKRWVSKYREAWGTIVEAPIWNYKDSKVWAKIKEYGIPLNPTYETLGFSGDCLCGSFGNDAEKKILQMYYPETYNEILRLESTERKYPELKWGNGEAAICSKENEMTDDEFLSCSSCKPRILKLEEVRL